MLLSSSLLLADNFVTTSSAKDVALTLYSNGISLVSEKRSATIKTPGKVKLMYAGVPSMIDTSSAIASFSQPVKLYSQNYSYDVISYDSLLKYHLGKPIIYIETKTSKEPKKGILLATNPILVKETHNGVIFRPFKLFFPDIPREMAIKPSLFWNIETQASQLDIDLKYLTRGMKWKSDYTLNLSDEKLLDLNSWITITNNSGATYEDANISVLAGEVKLSQDLDTHKLYTKRRVAASALSTEQNIQSQALLGYHIYHIPFKESIKDKEKKQISFIEKKAISYEKYAEHKEHFYFSNFGEKRLAFDQVIEFKNSKTNHLGIPLPQGNIRVYQKDNGGSSRFVGANTISNIPKDESVKITLGKHFDIVGKEKVVAFKQTNAQKYIKYEVTVNNRSKKEQLIKLQKNIPINQGKLTIKDNCKEQCNKKELNAFSTEYTLSLQPSEEYTLTISYDVQVY